MIRFVGIGAAAIRDWLIWTSVVSRRIRPSR
jgi:hypothetical protein